MKSGVRNAGRLVVLLAISPVILIIGLVIATGTCWASFIDMMKYLLEAWRDCLMECLGRGEEDKD